MEALRRQCWIAFTRKASSPSSSLSRCQSCAMLIEKSNAFTWLWMPFARLASFARVAECLRTDSEITFGHDRRRRCTKCVRSGCHKGEHQHQVTPCKTFSGSFSICVEGTSILREHAEEDFGKPDCTGTYHLCRFTGPHSTCNRSSGLELCRNNSSPCVTDRQLG